MTDQLSKLAERLREMAHDIPDTFSGWDAADLDAAAGLIESMAQRVQLTVDRIEELANQHNANLWRYHAYEQDAIIRLIRAVECEHGIVDRQED